MVNFTVSERYWTLAVYRCILAANIADRGSRGSRALGWRRPRLGSHEPILGRLARIWRERGDQVAVEREPVIFVPGIAGSTLKLGKRVVFGDINTAFTDFGDFTLPARLQPGEVIERVTVFSSMRRNMLGLKKMGWSYYGPFLTFLRQNLKYTDGIDLFPFAYDWRQSCRVSGMRLRQLIWEIGKRPEFKNTKVTIIAHSMGGLVARYCARLEHVPERVSRIITAGTPHRGSPNALLALRDGADILPGHYAKQDTIPALRSFPSTYETLPFENGYIVDDRRGILNIGDMKWWNWLSPIEQAHLKRAYAFHRFLNDGPDPVPIHSIYGHDQPTVPEFELPIYRAVVANRGQPIDPWLLLNFATYGRPPGDPLGRSGDDTVPETRAIQDPHLACAVNARHGDLLSHPVAKRYIRDMLTAASTVSVAGVAPPRAAQLVAYVDGQVFSPNKTFMLRVGLLDARGNYVRKAKFSVEEHRTNDRGESTSMVRGSCQEQGASAGELALYPFTPPNRGSYYFHVSVTDAQGATLDATNVDVDFQVQ